MITGLDHVQVAMPAGGESTTLKFFVEVLALEEIVKPHELASRGGGWFVLPDGRQLHYGVEDNFRPNAKTHPALTVVHIETLADRLAAASYTVVWDHALQPRRRFYSTDPFDNRLEFIEPEPV